MKFCLYRWYSLKDLAGHLFARQHWKQAWLCLLCLCMCALRLHLTKKKKEKERKNTSVHHLPHFNTILGRGITGCISKCTHIMWWCSTYTRALRIPDELNHGCKWKRHGTQEADAVVAWNHGCYHKCPLMRGWVQKPNNAFEEIFHAYADLDTMVV